MANRNYEAIAMCCPVCREVVGTMYGALKLRSTLGRCTICGHQIAPKPIISINDQLGTLTVRDKLADKSTIDREYNCDQAVIQSIPRQ